jgi:hypothetical protein
MPAQVSCLPGTGVHRCLAAALLGSALPGPFPALSLTRMPARSLAEDFVRQVT